MVRADKTSRILEVRGFAAGAALEIEQSEIDHAVAHVNRRADVQILAADPLEVEHGLVERRGLVEVAHAYGKMAQAGHGNSSARTISPPIRNIICNRRYA
jgi:hypothetical protein